MNFKTYEQYKNLAIAKGTSNLSELDSTTDPVLLTLAEAPGASAFSLQSIFVDLIEDVIFPQSSSGSFLRNIWGDYENLYPLAATPSRGYINVETDSTVTLGTEYTINGLVFTTLEASTDISGTYYVSFSEVDSETVQGTVYTDSTYSILGLHRLGTGNTVAVAGSEYTGEYTITVTGESTFTFSATYTSDENTSYTISESEYVLVKCNTTGASTNLDSGTLLPASAGSDDEAFITHQGLTGGADAETDATYRSRILAARSNIDGVFTNGQVILAALSINGNTRAFVVNPTIAGTGMPDTTGTYTADCTSAGTSVTNFETATPHYLVTGQEITIPTGSSYAGDHTITRVDATNFTIAVAHSDLTATYTVSFDQFEAANKDLIPQPGIVYVFVLRDNDSTITPSDAILDLTKTAILEDGKLPSHTPEANVVVFAPTLSYLSFEIEDLAPNTDTMKAAIKTQLQAFFEDNTTLSSNISMDAVRAAIWQTEDLVNNERITAFTLTNYGQNDGSVEAPAITVTDVSTITISQGSIAAFDQTDANSVTFVTST